MAGNEKKIKKTAFTDCNNFQIENKPNYMLKI